MRNFIPEEKRTIITAGAWVLFLCLFIIFVYMPKHRSVAKLKADLAAMEEQIELSQAMLGDVERLGHVLADMQKELASFEKRLPSRKQISSVLSELSRVAKTSSVEVVSIKPYEAEPLLNKNQEPISLDEKRLQKMRIELKLSAGYKALADYVKSIQESLNLLATIEEIAVAKKQDSAPNLEIELALSVYIGDAQQGT